MRTQDEIQAKLQEFLETALFCHTKKDKLYVRAIVLALSWVTEFETKGIPKEIPYPTEIHYSKKGNKYYVKKKSKRQPLLEPSS